MTSQIPPLKKSLLGEFLWRSKYFHIWHVWRGISPTDQSFSLVLGSKLLVLGMVIQPLIGNPYNGYINPYYWVDDHPLLYGNNGSWSTLAHFKTQLRELPKTRPPWGDVFFLGFLEGWDSRFILLMADILHQLRLVVFPIIFRVSYIPGGAGFQPSTVLIHNSLHLTSFILLMVFGLISLWFPKLEKNISTLSHPPRRNATVSPFRRKKWITVALIARWDLVSPRFQVPFCCSKLRVDALRLTGGIRSYCCNARENTEKTNGSTRISGWSTILIRLRTRNLSLVEFRFRSVHWLHQLLLVQLDGLLL